jgi:hypothetical protein
VTLGEACWITRPHPVVSVGLQKLHSPCPHVRQRDAQLSCPAGLFFQRFGSAVTLGEACWITITHPGLGGLQMLRLHVPMLTARCAAEGCQRGSFLLRFGSSRDPRVKHVGLLSYHQVSVRLQMLHSPCPYVDSAMRSCLVQAGSFLPHFGSSRDPG